MAGNTQFSDDEVLLRAFDTDDITFLHKYLNHPAIIGRRYIPWEFSDSLPLSKRHCEQIYNKMIEIKRGIYLAIAIQKTQELIGHLQSDWSWDTHSPSVSVVISPEYQRKRYGSKALRLFINYLFDNTPAHNVSLWIASWNIEGCAFGIFQGFKENGCMRRTGLRAGKYFDVIIMDILRGEWKK